MRFVTITAVVYPVRATLLFGAIFGFLLAFAVAGAAQAATYTMSPGDTFGQKVPQLQPGDTLILENGTYSGTNPIATIDCSANAQNGTAANPITIRARNERQAKLVTDGRRYSFQLINCNYWVIDGLWIEGMDNSAYTVDGSLIRFDYSNHITFRNNFVRYANRYQNQALVGLYYTNDSLIEENELYKYHRHAIMTKYGTGNDFRRNYCNGGDYPDIAGGWVSESAAYGEKCVSIYPGSFNISENNISENSDGNTDIMAISRSEGNQLLGLLGINLGGSGTVLIKARGATESTMAVDNIVKDCLAIDSDKGVFLRGNRGTNVDGCTILNSTKKGVQVDKEPDRGVDPLTAFIKNTLVVNSGSDGFYVSSDYTTWEIDHANSYNNAGSSYSPNNSNVTNSLTTDPQFNSCRVFVPDSSPMKGAGKNGADIGANVLYAYENGVLTNKPLWNTSKDGGQFIGCGAVVDSTMQTCTTVHRRLNVNYNGCLLPGGYEGATMPQSNTTSIVNMSTLTANSNNFDPDFGIDNLFDTCLDDTSGSGCTTGAGTSASFWAEFDIGDLYDFTDARLYGDDFGNWVSNSWTLEYKQKSTDPWKAAFTNANAFGQQWFTQDLTGITARFVKLIVNGGTGTQAAEFELHGSPATLPPTTPGDLNGDSVVNSLDWSVMNGQWGTSGPEADLNGDGLVNSLDFSILNSNWSS